MHYQDQNNIHIVFYKLGVCFCLRHIQFSFNSSKLIQCTLIINGQSSLEKHVRIYQIHNLFCQTRCVFELYLLNCALFSLYKQAGTAIRQPDCPGPGDFLVLALSTLILCGLLNLTSLFMSIPALIFASLVG